ncbi:MAG: FtsQ-type POTRA domain-containing protein [Acidobacteriota bacterium]
MKQAGLVCLAVVLAAVAGMAAPLAAAQDDPPIVEIRVHGNHVTPDADVLAVSGLKVGDASSEANLTAAKDRIEASGRFASVAVRRLARSIDDPNDVMVMLLVEEVAGASEDIHRPGWLRQTAAGVMWVPVLRYEEGYGVTFGLQPAVADLFGANSQLAVPLTWGGERRAGVELSRSFAGPIVSRVSVGSDVRQTEHPAFDVTERRSSVRGRIERSLGANLRLGAAAAHDRVRFASERAALTTYTADVTLDTRLDPVFPRNALWGTAAIDRLALPTGTRVRQRVDGHAAVGLMGGSALTLSAFQTSVDGALPAYEQAFIGGGPSLRGFRRGYRVADNAAGASASLAMPVGSPLSSFRTGVRLFADWAGVYSAGTSWRDASYDRGVGAGVFALLPGFTTGLDVARGDRHWRAHFRIGTRF